MNKKTLLTRLGGLVSHKEATFDKRMIHPLREWLIGVFFFLVIIIIGGAYSALLFVEYKNIAADENASQDPVVRYNQVLVEHMLTQYQARSEAYDAFTTNIGATASEENVMQSDPITSTSTVASSSPEVIETTEEERDTETGEAVMAN